MHMRQLEMKKKEKFLILWDSILMNRICIKIWEEKIHSRGLEEEGAVIRFKVLLVNFSIWEWEVNEDHKKDRTFFYL